MRFLFLTMTEKPEKDEYEIIHEYRKCSVPECRNIVTHWAQKKGYTGPVYCQKHWYKIREENT